ncbi:hypothetical protein THASP1DRAFT_23147 [Thamnocephalis sphaerospora]|uniref:Pericentrin/AKAP-450 centrosomal targeting domain-containing protein n=1 Tax=Thamnocephalis sphaerospora TaxID=78915 RepID=A0A4V1IWW3_9FUNG|nr:hypothetical protein THASP1DRAFT_23147 [Thamnocephalis sphaerospora]|eukprot:RKP08959.1 hypothetical protein THASP1DRAFT_23147 [Thamnocephalis sphaerospora]
MFTLHANVQLATTTYTSATTLIHSRRPQQQVRRTIAMATNGTEDGGAGANGHGLPRDALLPSNTAHAASTSGQVLDAALVLSPSQARASTSSRLRNLRRERTVSMPPVSRNGENGPLENIFAMGKWPPSPGGTLDRPATASPLARSFISEETGQVDMGGFNPAFASSDDLSRALHQALSDLAAITEERDMWRRRLMTRADTLGGGAALAVDVDEGQGQGQGDSSGGKASPQLTRELSETVRKVAELKRMLSGSDNSASEARLELQRVKQEHQMVVDRLKADVETLTESLSDVTEDLSKCREELRESREETENVRAWLEASWADRERLEEELAQLHEAYPDLVAQQVTQNGDGEDDEEELDEEVRALIGLRSKEEVEKERIANLEQATARIIELERHLNNPLAPLDARRRTALENALAEARDAHQKFCKPLFDLSSPAKHLSSRRRSAHLDATDAGDGSSPFLTPKRPESQPPPSQQHVPSSAYGARHQRTMSEIEFFITELEADLTTSQQENSMLKTQLENAPELAALKEQIAELTKQLKERDDALIQTHGDLKKAEAQLNEVQAAAAAATATASATASTAKPAGGASGRAGPRSPNDSETLIPRDEYDELEERRAELDVRCTELEIAVVGLEEERNRWARERSELEEELNDFAQQRTNWSEERERMNAKLAEMEEKSGELDKSKEDMEREIKVLREEKEQLEARIAAATNIDLEKADDSVLELDPEWRMRIQLLNEERNKAVQTKQVAETEVQRVHQAMKKLESEKRMLVERLAVVHRRQAETAVAAASSSSAAARSIKKKGKKQGHLVHQRSYSGLPVAPIDAAPPMDMQALARSASHGAIPTNAQADVPSADAADSPLRSLEKYRRRIEEIRNQKLGRQGPATAKVDKQAVLATTVRNLYLELDDRDRSLDQMRERLAEHFSDVSDDDEVEKRIRRNSGAAALAERTRKLDVLSPPVSEPLMPDAATSEPSAPAAVSADDVATSTQRVAQATEEMVAELRREIYTIRGDRETLRARVRRLEAALQDARDRAEDFEEETAVLRGNISVFMDRARGIPDVDLLLDPERTHPLLAVTDDLISRLQQNLSTLRVEKDAIGVELEEGLRHCYEEAAREIELRDEEMLEWQQRCAELEAKLGDNDGAAPVATSRPANVPLMQRVYTVLHEALVRLEATGYPLDERWLELLKEVSLAATTTTTPSGERASENQQGTNGTDDVMNGDVTWLGDLEPSDRQGAGVAQQLQTQLEQLQEQLDERNQEYDQMHIHLAQTEHQLVEAQEKLQESMAAARVAEEMNTMMREELVRKQRDMDELRDGAGDQQKLDQLAVGNDSLEYRAANASISMEYNINAVLDKNAQTLDELDRLCRVMAAPHRSQPRLGQPLRRSHSATTRTTSRASSTHGSTAAPSFNDVAEQGPGHLMLLELREFGLQMREFMEEHTALKQHLDGQVSLRGRQNSEGREPLRPGATDMVTIIYADLEALGTLGEAMARTTIGFLANMEKVAPRLLRSIMDTASSVTAVEGSGAASRPTSAMSTMGGFGGDQGASRDIHILQDRIVRLEAMCREEHEHNQRYQADLQMLEEELHMERKEHQASVNRLQLQIQRVNEGSRAREMAQMEQDNAALMDEIADLEARVAQEHDAHENEVMRIREEYEEIYSERGRHREISRQLAREIRYLQAKCQRELIFQRSLQFQKRYLLMIIGGMESSEQATLRMILEMVPTQNHGSLLPVASNDKFRTAVFAVIATIRMRMLAINWASAKQQRNLMAAGEMTDVRSISLPPPVHQHQELVSNQPVPQLPLQPYQRRYARPSSAAYPATNSEAGSRSVSQNAHRYYAGSDQHLADLEEEERDHVGHTLRHYRSRSTLASNGPPVTMRRYARGQGHDIFSRLTDY